MMHWLPCFLAGFLFGPLATLQGATMSSIAIKGPIGPATVSYVSRAIKVAQKRHDVCLVIQLDTPGGSLDATKEIVQKFYDSAVPIVVYVSPAGAWAGSAGCFITIAADVAAMAPSTSIGAAHPVAIGPGGPEKSDDVMKQKMENFASSYIESIAEKRGRNVEWAKSSVVKSESITASRALELKVIDLVADDLADLLSQIDGRKIKGRSLATTRATMIEIPMTFREKALKVLSHPELMLFLMLVAMYGIIGELSNPGAILPGVAGAIALILVLYMSAILPINLAGLALIGLAAVLFLVDIYAPTHGVLTGGGILSFFLGALMLFNRGEEGFSLSLAFIIPATSMTALFFILVAGAGLRAQKLPVRAGAETMLGKTAPALTPIELSGGKVFVEGELWNAVSDTPIAVGQLVEIVAIQGLTLTVKPQTTRT